MRPRYFFLFALFALASCGSNEPPFPIEPEIGFISVSRTVLNEQPDSLRVEFSFKDGDGDLGFSSYDSTQCNLCSDECLAHPTLSIFVYDSRNPGCVVPYNVPYVPPGGKNDAIAGKVSLVLSACCLIDNFACPVLPGVTDTVVYTIQLKDRAGHLSNKIAVPPVAIHCN